jgi:hypothetical protein
MNDMTRILFFGILFTAMILTGSGCDTTMDPENPNTQTGVAGPSNLRAYSMDSSRVGLTWNLSPDENKQELLNYVITVRDTAGNVRTPISAVKGQSAATVSGLTEGVVYIFTIRNNVTSGAVSTDSATVRWSPAKRFDSEGSAPIQVFETADPNRPSGLDLYSPSTNGPVTRSITGPTNALVDLFVATLSGSQNLEIRSASLSTSIPSGKVTTFDPNGVNAASLNSDPRLVPPAATAFTTLVVTVPNAPASQGLIFWGKTQEGNYFRLFIESNGTSLISGPVGNRFITVRISYQSVVGNPYSIRERIHHVAVE